MPGRNVRQIRQDRRVRRSRIDPANPSPRTMNSRNSMASTGWLAGFLCLAAFVAPPVRGADTAQPATTTESKTAVVQPAAAQPAGPKVCDVFRVRDQDQVWAVSTRCLGCPVGGNQTPAWTVWRYEKNSWQNSTSDEFYKTDSPEVVTAFFVHGNRVDDGEALSDGLDIYFQLAGKFEDERPVRFVVWSWPSAQIKGPLKDVRSKAWRSDTDAYYIGRFLAGIDPDVQVGLIGFSYGARIINGGMHLLGGGQMVGQTLPPTERPMIRVALWAPATHNHWLLPGHYHGEALKMGDAWYSTINCCDPALQRYRFLEKCGDPVAQGYSGIYGRNLLPPDINQRIEEVNVSCLVGGTHAMRPYLYSQPIINRTRQYVLWHELETAKAEKKPAQQLAAAGTK